MDERRDIEEAAILVVKQYEKDRGYHAETKQGLPYDIESKRGNKKILIEVKANTRSGYQLLTANQKELFEKYPLKAYLYIVRFVIPKNATIKGKDAFLKYDRKIYILQGHEVNDLIKPKPAHYYISSSNRALKSYDSSNRSEIA
jgi:hypothetical protein